jgi:hypothetical protein
MPPTFSRTSLKRGCNLDRHMRSLCKKYNIKIGDICTKIVGNTKVKWIEQPYDVIIKLYDLGVYIPRFTVPWCTKHTVKKRFYSVHDKVDNDLKECSGKCPDCNENVEFVYLCSQCYKLKD